MVSDNKADTNKIDSKILPPDAPVPRLCTIIKWPDFDGFGFNLQLGHYIGKVDPDSPAELADLREGDQIIEVNGIPISNENHKQVVQRIKAVPNETQLLVINQTEYEWYKDRNLIIRQSQENVIHCKTPVPRPGSTIVSEEKNRTDANYDAQTNGTKNESLNKNESSNLNESLNKNESLNLNESLNKSLNASSNFSEHKNEDQQYERQDSPLAEEIFNALEAKNTPAVDEVANILSSTKLRNEASPNSTIENNNNSEKATNQNLVISPVKNVPQKSHNFIVVNSEKEFEAEKRIKEEKKKNNLLNINSTSIKPVYKEPENNHLSTTNSISSSNNPSANQTNGSDLNLDMSASEMRKIIASRRNVKADCKKQPLDLRQKYEIIQQM